MGCILPEIQPSLGNGVYIDISAAGPYYDRFVFVPKCRPVRNSGLLLHPYGGWLVLPRKSCFSSSGVQGTRSFGFRALKRGRENRSESIRRIVLGVS